MLSHAAFGPASRRPTLPASGARELRARLLAEEFGEYRVAEAGGDLVAIADALADMAYVIYGTAHVDGLDLDTVIAEVHRANMSKLADRDDEAGRPVLRDGKPAKGPSYRPPDVAAALAAPGCVGEAAAGCQAARRPGAGGLRGGEPR
jgi:predicted HAD superfamily Cof-like phosphohydrolase